MKLQEFEQQLKSLSNPVIVDFWAPWCVPCRVTKPVLESLAKEYEGKVNLLMMNADDHPELLRELRVFGIPTILITRSGEIINQLSGAQSRENYRKMFEALANANETVTIPIFTFDRLLRLFSGTILAIIGLIVGAWYLLAIGGVIAFLGIYDRCPIWRAITRQFNKKTL